MIILNFIENYLINSPFQKKNISPFYLQFHALTNTILYDAAKLALKFQKNIFSLMFSINKKD